ncbi:MAG: superoxide dismutase [Bacteroidetes bacterium]|nr:MAG: superoxide dismutase [Bacteroidota bacterium]
MDKNPASRRKFLKQGSALALAGLAAQLLPSNVFASMQEYENMEDLNTFELPKLAYSYEALEPHIDKMTMEIHYSKHHAGYVKNLNAAVKENNISGTLEDIIKNAGKHPVAIRNNGGGHWNHSFFWKLMAPAKGAAPSGKMNEVINASFGGFENFQKIFNEAGTKRFGSGWAWLILNKDKKLEVGSTANQDNPLMDISEFSGTPIMAVDVWEHAYYLKYQNLRGDYLKAWWNVLNWDQISSNLEMAEKG